MLSLFRKAGCLISGLVSLAGFVILLFVFLLLFISPIAHWAIEKYSPKYLGRQVLVRHLHIGLLSGKVHVEGFRMMETNRSDTFVYAGDAFVRLSVRQAISGHYRVDSVVIDTLFARINQKGSLFNFDDLIQRFATADTAPQPTGADTVRYSTGSIAIQNIHLVYTNQMPAVELSLAGGRLLIPGLAWNDPIIRLEASTLINQQGKIDAELQFDQSTAAYSLTLKADSVSTQPLFPYLADYLNSTRADGLLTTRLKLKGNSTDPAALALSGKIAFDRFVLTNRDDEKQIGWNSFSIEIDSINTSANLYRFNNVVLSEPYLLVTMTREGNNLTAIMKQPTTTETPGKLEGAEGTPLDYANPFIMMAEVIGQIAEQYSKNEYGMNRFAIEHGTILYNDFLTNEKFSVLFQEFNAHTASFNDASQAVKFDISTLMNRYGHVKAKLSVDNRNFKDFDLELGINSLTMSVFNPYTKYYVAHPFWRGDVSFTNTMSVKNGQLKSNNRLLVKQIKVGDKIKSDSAFHIPVKLAVAILRDRKGNIDLEIPIDGSLHDPNYRWGKAVLKIIGNLLVKAVTAPWDFLSRAIGGNPEDLKAIEFDPLQDSINRPQQRNLDAIGKVLREKPDLLLKLTFRYNTELERDEVAVRDALKKWHGENLASADSSRRVAALKTPITALSVNDTTFQQWLTRRTGITSPTISLPEKCLKAIGGAAAADAVIAMINRRRDDAVQNYLISKFQIPASSIVIHHNTDEGHSRNTARPTYDTQFDTQ